MSKQLKVVGGAVKVIRELKAKEDPAFRLSRFSLACGMTPAALCNIEAGRRKHIDEAVIRLIATKLDVPLTAVSFEVDAPALAASA